MTKSILTIGIELASDAVKQVDFRSKLSLLDWDIVLFRPIIDDLIEGAGLYQGMPSLDDSGSLSLKESCEHWRREIKQASENGKTVIVFLAQEKKLFVRTGEETYVGTGRNRTKTVHVQPYSNYNSIPFPQKLVSTTGRAMKLVPLDAELLAPYWAEFGPISEYKLILPPESKACLVTKHGDKPVGAIQRSKTSSGALVLLPDIDFYPDNFFAGGDDDADESLSIGGWSTKASQFAAKLTSTVVALDKVLHSSADITPEPAWAASPLYSLATERVLRSEHLRC